MKFPALQDEDPSIQLRTDTDTEVVAALALFLWRRNEGKIGFRYFTFTAVIMMY